MSAIDGHIETLEWLSGQYLPGGPRDVKGAIRAATAALAAKPLSAGEGQSTKGESDDGSRNELLIDRLTEVVRHSPDCSGLGRGDEHCNCDAVAALTDTRLSLAEALETAKAWNEMLGEKRHKSTCRSLGAMIDGETPAACTCSSDAPAIEREGVSREARDIMLSFYASDKYDPNAARHADVVEAAIAYTLALTLTAPKDN